MPQPFENLTMDELANMSKQELFKVAQKPGAAPNEIRNTEKVASLAHFLIHNYKSELSSDEHVVDAAIRILKRVKK